MENQSYEKKNYEIEYEWTLVYIIIKNLKMSEE